MVVNNKPPRIIICGVGKYGSIVAEIALEKGWQVVGAYNRKGPKVGRDLGQYLENKSNTGVVIQDLELADFNSIDADLAIVAIHDFLALNHALHLKLLNAGINVLCHGTQSYFPEAIDQSMALELDLAGKKNGVTFTGSGIWDLSRIWAGILVAGASTKIDGINHVSVSDVDRLGPGNVPLLGVGFESEEFKQQLTDSGRVVKLYEVALAHVLSGLGYTVTATSEIREPVVFDQPVFCESLDKEIPAGVCVGTRFMTQATTVEGLTANGHIEMRLLQPGEVEYMSWEVSGKPNVKIRVEREDSVYFSASSLFNRIKQVIAAPPGLVTVDRLGPPKHSVFEW